MSRPPLQSPRLPESTALLAWMVALVPFGFLSLFTSTVFDWEACVDGCVQAPDGFGLARNAWLLACASWLLTLFVAVPRVTLMVATTGFVVTLTVTLVGWAW